MKINMEVVRKEKKILRKIIFLYLISRKYEKKSYIIKLVNSFYIFKLFNFYIMERNKRNEFE